MKKTSSNHSASRRLWLGGGLSYLALVSLATTLSACGLRLRGRVNLPYKSLLLTGTITPELKDDIELLLRVNDIELAKTVKDSELVLEIISEQNARQVLSYNTSGQITAYRIISRVVFRAFDPISGLEATPESDIFLTRDIDFNQSNIQAFDQQVAEFIKNMRTDIVSQLMRRLASIKKLPTEADLLKRNSSINPSNPSAKSSAPDSKK
jgi:LPS-assembly lipoprotein